MSNSITKEHAETIAKKLNAEIKEGAKHDLARISHNNKIVAQFGIRRGSRKDASHSYISGQIYLSKKDCLRLAQCTLDREGWITILEEKGHIDKDEEG